MPRQHRAAVQRCEVHSEGFFNASFVLPVAPPSRPRAAVRLPCDFSLRIISDDGEVAFDGAVTVLHSEPFPYRGSTLETFSLGDPVLLSRGRYRIEIDNRADTPAFKAPGAGVRLEPHATIASTALTQLLLVAGILLLALGSLALAAPSTPFLGRKRDAT
jgi:hypothetical protein